jgi:hypothetical protein
MSVNGQALPFVTRVRSATALTVQPSAFSFRLTPDE